jgi:hypothetical protein
MSFDIIILKPTDLTVNDLSAVEDVAPLGSTASVSGAFNNAFPGCTEGAFIAGDRYAVELSLSGEPVESAHLAVRYGKLWSEETETQFQELLSSVCHALGGVAFAVSDNSRLSP